MYGRLLFSVPIHARSLEENRRAMTRKRDSYVREATRLPHHLPREQLEEEFNRYHWVPWQYTQIVGHVELRLVDGAIKAYYWYVDAKRISAQLRRKNFLFAGKLTDVCSDLNDKDNADIRADIREFLARLPKLGHRFKARFFDTASVETILDGVDFSALAAKHGDEM